MMFWEMRLQHLVNEEKPVGTYEITWNADATSYQAEFISIS